MKAKIEEIIKTAIEEVNSQLDDDAQIVFSNKINFIGKNACLDSVALVTFILTIEELIEDTLDTKVQLVTDKAFSSNNSPFYSVETLTSYIQELIKG